MEYLSSPRIWLTAALLAIILSSAFHLDGPSDIEVMQAVADQTQAVQSDKLVLAGTP
jgi:hypothetical protein